MWHCLSRVKAMTDEAVSVIHLHSFPCIDEFYHKRTLRCNRKPETFMHARKTRWFKPPMPLRQSGTNLHEQQRAHFKTSSGGRAHEIRNEFEWYTHRLECNSDFSAWDVDVLVSLNSAGILDVTQTRSYFAEPHLTYGRPGMRSKSVVDDPLPSAGLLHDLAWMFHYQIEPS